MIHKKECKKNLKNWRPISLLNTDYKLLAKILSARLKTALEEIINADQTCSVPGRSINQNLTLIRDTLDYIGKTEETGILMNLDQEKAFD